MQSRDVQKREKLDFQGFCTSKLFFYNNLHQKVTLHFPFSLCITVLFEKSVEAVLDLLH